MAPHRMGRSIFLNHQSLKTSTHKFFPKNFLIFLVILTFILSSVTLLFTDKVNANGDKRYIYMFTINKAIVYTDDGTNLTYKRTINFINFNLGTSLGAIVNYGDYFAKYSVTDLGYIHLFKFNRNGQFELVKDISFSGGLISNAVYFYGDYLYYATDENTNLKRINIYTGSISTINLKCGKAFTIKYNNFYIINGSYLERYNQNYERTNRTNLGLETSSRAFITTDNSYLYVFSQYPGGIGYGRIRFAKVRLSDFTVITSFSGSPTNIGSPKNPLQIFNFYNTNRLMSGYLDTSYIFYIGTFSSQTTSYYNYYGTDHLFYYNYFNNDYIYRLASESGSYILRKLNASNMQSVKQVTVSQIEPANDLLTGFFVSDSLPSGGGGGEVTTGCVGSTETGSATPTSFLVNQIEWTYNVIGSYKIKDVYISVHDENLTSDSYALQINEGVWQHIKEIERKSTYSIIKFTNINSLVLRDTITFQLLRTGGPSGLVNPIRVFTTSSDIDNDGDVEMFSYLTFTDKRRVNKDIVYMFCYETLPGEVGGEGEVSLEDSLSIANNPPYIQYESLNIFYTLSDIISSSSLKVTNSSNTEYISLQSGSNVGMVTYVPRGTGSYTFSIVRSGIVRAQVEITVIANTANVTVYTIPSSFTPTDTYIDVYYRFNKNSDGYLLVTIGDYHIGEVSSDSPITYVLYPIQPQSSGVKRFYFDFQHTYYPYQPKYPDIYSRLYSVSGSQFVLEDMFITRFSVYDNFRCTISVNKTVIEKYVNKDIDQTFRVYNSLNRFNVYVELNGKVIKNIDKPGLTYFTYTHKENIDTEFNATLKVNINNNVFTLAYARYVLRIVGEPVTVKNIAGDYAIYLGLFITLSMLFIPIYLFHRFNYHPEGITGTISILVCGMLGLGVSTLLGCFPEWIIVSILLGLVIILTVIYLSRKIV
jgi:hypothetical protein